MTNARDANEIIMYIRDEETGMLTYPNSFRTGGVGGNSVLESGPDDPLASQGSLIVSGSCLLAVNAGSNTVTSFQIVVGEDPRIERVSIVGAGGDIPVSLAANGDGIAYVVNAGGPGSISGFHLDEECRLDRIPNSIISLNQAPATTDDAPPFFLSSPSAIDFTPDGEELIVVIKGIDGDPTAGGTINRFPIDASTGLVSDPIVFETGSDGVVPFSLDFDDEGNLLALDVFGNNPFGTANAGVITLYTFDEVTNDLTIGDTDSIPQTAACWIQYDDGCAFVANNGSNSVSTVGVENGKVTLIEAIAAELNAPVDVRLSPDGQFMYVLSTGHFSGGQPSIYIYKRGIGCGLTQVGAPVSDGIPDEFVTIFGAMGLAVFDQM
jgi:6-phosphogluconolactonase (cycloisomerase 2 family)